MQHSIAKRVLVTGGGDTLLVKADTPLMVVPACLIAWCKGAFATAGEAA